MKIIANTPREKLTRADDKRVATAMGAKFEQFQKLAAMFYEQPATRAYVESQMTKLLESMTPEERKELRLALHAAGAYGRRTRR